MTYSQPIVPTDALHNAVIEWLRENNCTLKLRVSQYDPERYNLLTNHVSVPVSGAEQEWDFLTSKWTAWACAKYQPMRPAMMDFAVTFKCEAGQVADASVSVDLEFSGWSEKNYVVMPSAAYNGNRYPARRIPYSPKLYYAQDIGPDKPMILTDVPKLSECGGPSRIQERSGSMATPAIGFRCESSNRGFWLLTDQGNSLGDYGISIEETRRRDRAVISITAPVVRELYNYRICDMAHPSMDVPANFKAGDEITIAFTLFFFEARWAQSLFAEFVHVRKRRTTMRPKRCVLPYSACFELQEEKFNRENFVPEHGYYSVGPRTNFLQDWQIGWTGGMISTYPLLFAGNDVTRQNVLRNFDWLFPNGISPSGFFWDAGQHGTQWIGGDIRKPHTGNWHLIRKSGDAVYYIIKQFLLMRKLGIEIKPAWHAGTARVCDALVELWKKNRQFGQFVDSMTGEIRVGGSTSGAIIPAALALAAAYFGKDEYLQIALQAAEHFYRNFTYVGMSCGGPGDACQNPDSESWYALIESYMAMYDATRAFQWLHWATETAWQFATWVVSYDFEFPPDSMFGKADIRTTGAVYANTQNKHAAPGLCTYSGLGLLKLFRATDDSGCLEMLRDIARHLPQYLPHPLRPLGDATFGHMCERVNMTDWEGPERIGETLRMSTWAETSLMLTTIEIPGVYVRPDMWTVMAFDNIEAEIITRDSTTMTVKLTNPTPAAARVSVFCENAAQARRPLPENALLGIRSVSLGPGESTSLTFANTGPNH